MLLTAGWWPEEPEDAPSAWGWCALVTRGSNDQVVAQILEIGWEND